MCVDDVFQLGISVGGRVESDVDLESKWFADLPAASLVDGDDLMRAIMRGEALVALESGVERTKALIHGD